MLFRLFGVALLVISAALNTAYATTPFASITGIWKTAGDEGYVCIYLKNGVAYGQSLGRLNNTVQEAQTYGEPQILSNFVNTRSGRWTGGRIYDPNNKTYFHGILTAVATNRLKVYGYVGLPWLGGETIWTKIKSSEPSGCN